MRILMVSVCLFLAIGCSGKKAVNFGMENGQFVLPDVEKPNWVSTQAKDPEHKIDPLKYRGNLLEAKKALINIIKSSPRTEIIENRENYIYATYTSFFFRFVDDVQIYLDEANKLIHMQSQSRVGKSDFGVNKKRLGELSFKFVQSGM